MFLSSLRPVLQLYPLFQLGTAGKASATILKKDESAPINAKVLLNHEVYEEIPDPIGLQGIFGDLPRVIRPDGKDDTDEIRLMVMKAFPELKYFPDQTNNRRNLYMAIHKMRTQGSRPWILDEKPANEPKIRPWAAGPTVLQ